uniref:Cytochrome c oxidase subunit 3 n=1 Tax=Pseudocellus gertschi TaxID=1329481 RepID=W5R4N8_9ARAC|nr:cytochrome c oxidase subunit III [Pseudocellus gertschi]AGL11937.1 cytochrome c oxidase subunit III [Pseudocellus gertschi]
MKHHHPYHMVEQSPWPLMSMFTALMMTSSMIMWFHNTKPLMIMLTLMMMIMTMFQWWRDITREATIQGHHPTKVIKNLKWGMILFIVSEVMFFLSFFWAFFHMSLAPSMEIGSVWPPSGISSFNPLGIPLLNTAILVSSGVMITWTHHSILNNKIKQAKTSLLLTIILGVYFTTLQAFEYLEASFSMADSCYGSTFFVATGFHGLHVIIGTTFLTTCFLRLMNLHFSNKHHFGFEASAWYWHFVDVVWLFLFISIYWWGKF